MAESLHVEKQNMGREGAMYAELKAVDRALGEWVNRWSELSKRAHQWADRLRGAGDSPLVKAMTALGRGAAEGGPLQRLMQDCTELHGALQSMREQLADDTDRLLVEPAEKHIREVVTPAREEVVRVKKLQKLVDERGIKQRTLCARETTDGVWAAQVLEGSHRLWEARHRLRTGMRRAQARVAQAAGANEAGAGEWLAGWLGARQTATREAARAETRWRGALETGRRLHEEWRRRAEGEAEAARLGHASGRMEGDLEKLVRFVERLGAEDLLVVGAVVTAAEAEREAVLSAMVQVLDAFGRALPIIHLGIVAEVASTQKASTLFRGNSMSTKLMTAFTRHTGLPYLRATIGPVICDVLAQDPSLFEVDPKHGQPEPENLERLEQLTLLFLDTLFSSVSLMPVPFRWMARTLHDEVAKRFPDSKRSSVGGFLFLRFICPAMLSPEHFGLVPEGAPPLLPAQRRPLTLVSKVLQNLSNQVMFGQKEAFLEPLNQLLRLQASRLSAFFDQVIDIAETRPELVKYESLVSVQECKTRVLPTLIDMTVRNFDRVAAKMLSSNASSELLPFADLLAKIVAFEGHKGTVVLGMQDDEDD